MDHMEGCAGLSFLFVTFYSSYSPLSASNRKLNVDKFSYGRTVCNIVFETICFSWITCPWKATRFNHWKAVSPPVDHLNWLWVTAKDYVHWKPIKLALLNCSDLSSGLYCRVKWLSTQKTDLNIILAAVRTWNLTFIKLYREKFE
jgi:hypothetical protein